MYKIGQNVTVGYPDASSPHKPGVINRKEIDPVRGVIYGVRVQEANGVVHCGDSYLEADVRPLAPTTENPNPEHFSVGNHVIIDGEQWKIRSIEGDGDEAVYVVYDYGMPVRVVQWSDFA
jgi:hypothetical protein